MASVILSLFALVTLVFGLRLATGVTRTVLTLLLLTALALAALAYL